MSGKQLYRKNMLDGIQEADEMAIVVVEAGRYEDLFSSSNENHYYCQLVHARCMGITKFIFAVNKIEKPDENKQTYSQETFEKTRDSILKALKKLRIDTNKVMIIPISGLTGENLTVPSQNLAWFQGPTLLSALNALPLPKEHPHPESYPLRLSIKSVFQVG